MNRRKLFGTILGVIIWCCCIAFFTYAWYTWRSSNNLVNINISDPVKYLKKGEVFVENKKSDILKEDREFLEYSITEFKVIKGSDENRVVIEIKNRGNDKISEREIVVKLLNKSSNTIDNVYIFVPEMKGGDVLYLNGITNIAAEKIFDYKIVEMTD